MSENRISFPAQTEATVRTLGARDGTADAPMLLMTSQQAAEQSQPPAAAMADLRVDTGAQALVKALEDAIARPQEDAITIIHLQGLKNLARTPHEELDELRTRVLTLVEPACAGRGIRVVGEESDAVEYTLAGAAYLTQRDGFDQWEIYLSLRPRDANWAIWRNEAPIRLLRQKQPSGDVLAFTPGAAE